MLIVTGVVSPSVDETAKINRYLWLLGTSPHKDETAKSYTDYEFRDSGVVMADAELALVSVKVVYSGEENRLV